MCRSTAQGGRRCSRSATSTSTSTSTTTTAPTVPTDKGGRIDLVTAAEAMYGTGSPQHLQAVKRWGHPRSSGGR